MSCADIDALLQDEPRDYIRRRLIAVRAIYAGGTYAEAMRDAGTTCGSVRRWLRQAQAEGIAALRRPAEGGKPAYRFTVARAAKVRDAMAAALDRTRDPAVRTRLLAVQTVLAGSSVASAAREGGVTTTAVCTWLRAAHRRGVDALLTGDRTPILTVDAETLRSRARMEPDHRVVLRLSAIALLAEGRSCQQAADRLGVSFATVHLWLNRFRADGIDGLRDRPAVGRPHPPAKRRSSGRRRSTASRRPAD